MNDTIIGDLDNSVVSRNEIDLKISKINGFISTVENRIATHEASLSRLRNISERDKVREQIARLTRKILEKT